MWTGRDALQNIDRAIQQLHRDESGIDRAIDSAMADAERLRGERGQALRELARVKLDELGSGRLTSNLDAAERRALQLLEGRRSRIARAAEGRDAALADVAKAEEERAAAAAKVEAALAELDALRAKAEAASGGDPALADAKSALAEAQAIAQEARRKAEQNAAELAEKKKPYDEDPLFQYLWKRGFGTQAYASTGLTRFLDRMVASFIGYLDVRANYHMLNEIPLRLIEHADEKDKAVEAAKDRLVRLQVEAMGRSGMPAQEARLAEARRALAAADAKLDSARQLLADADAQREQLVAGVGDPAYVEAMATLAANDSKDTIQQLYAEARRTPTNADENIVRRIEDIDARIEKADREVRQLRAAAQQLAQRRVEVERTRDRFRRSGYDHPNATFGNDRAIQDTLRNVLTGAVGGAVGQILWDVLRGGYSTRPPTSNPDFGGGFPFPMPGPWGGGGDVSGGGWRDPGSRGGWTPQDAPDLGPAPSGPWGGGGGGSNNDSFETGGRF